MHSDQIKYVAALDGRRTGAAIYALEHVPSGRRLVCQTTCLSKRLYDQRKYLERREHHNPALWADLVRDGAEAFRFVLLDLCHDRRHLAPLKRWHVNDAISRGVGVYNPPDPPARKLLKADDAHAPSSGASATAASDRLTAALERLRRLGRPSVPDAEAVIARIRSLLCSQRLRRLGRPSVPDAEAVIARIRSLLCSPGLPGGGVHVGGTASPGGGECP